MFNDEVEKICQNLRKKIMSPKLSCNATYRDQHFRERSLHIQKENKKTVDIVKIEVKNSLEHVRKGGNKRKYHFPSTNLGKTPTANLS